MEHCRRNRFFAEGLRSIVLARHPLVTLAILGLSIAIIVLITCESRALTHDEFVKLLEERGDLVYIADRGLVYFGKFVLGVLAFLGFLALVGFGINIKGSLADTKKASEDAKAAKFEAQNAQNDSIKASREVKDEVDKTLRELSQFRAEMSEHKKLLISAEEQLNQSQKSINELAEWRKKGSGYFQEITNIRLRMLETGGDTASVAVITSSKSSGTTPAPAELAVTQRVALVSQVPQLTIANLSRIAAVLQKQITRDLKPTWGVDAMVEAFLDNAPDGYSPIIIKTDIGVPGAMGIHDTKDGVPFAMVTYHDDLPTLSLNISHQLLQVLTDPQGNRFISAPSPNPADKGKPVAILVEIPDPCEAAEFAYKIDDLLVSDFVIPEYYSAAENHKRRYSFSGAVTKPRAVLKGGYLSWRDAETEEWFQSTWFDGDKPVFRSLGKIS